jgi:RNA polymerase sigma factor (TIGR02999 family)
VYAELRRRAASHLRGERRNHTLGATALVHEAFLRLAGQNADFENRTHFFAVAATMMRRILVDNARARAAAKRPQPGLQITLDPAIPSPAPDALEVLSLDQALSELAARDPRQAQLVELRYFGGLTVEEAATFLGLSARTIKRDWNLAKAWLYQRLKPTPGQKAPS